MIGYGLTGLVLTFFLYVCFDEAQACECQDDWWSWSKAVIIEFVFMALIFVAGVLVAVQK